MMLAQSVNWFTWQGLRSTPGSWLYRLFLISLTYALVMPRYKNYSLILLLVPGYFVIVQTFERRDNLDLLLLLFSASLPIPFGFSGAASRLLWGYYPILLAALLWWVVVRMNPDQTPMIIERVLPKEV